MLVSFCVKIIIKVEYNLKTQVHIEFIQPITPFSRAMTLLRTKTLSDNQTATVHPSMITTLFPLVSHD